MSENVKILRLVKIFSKFVSLPINRICCTSIIVKARAKTQFSHFVMVGKRNRVLIF